jgi:hypothetical protein
MFYNLVRFYRARMTRLKLAAEHDMSTNFSLAKPEGYKLNSAGVMVPKFRFGLLDETDATARDMQQGRLDEVGNRKVQQGGRPGQKVFTVPTTPELLSARRQAAINYQQLVLDRWRYGEVTVAYRKHDGGFPVFTMFSPGDQGFLVGTVNGDIWTAKQPKEVIPDKPA